MSTAYSKPTDMVSAVRHPSGFRLPIPDRWQLATVFVVDDDLSFLRAISRLLRAAGYHVVLYNSATELLTTMQPTLRGCVITDLMMPGMDGIALQQALQKSDNPLPVVFLTGHGNIPATVQAMRRGAEDFLTKNASKEDLLAAVDRALSRNRRESAERERLRELREMLGVLTDREREVLQLVVQGKLNKEIADALGIHERTVKLHRTGFTTKLKMHSVAELTRLVQEVGLG